MWLLSAVLVSCVFGAVFGDRIDGGTQEYAGRTAAKKSPNHISGGKPVSVVRAAPLPQNVYHVKNPVTNVPLRGAGRQTRNSLFPFGVSGPHGVVPEQAFPDVEVRSSRLRVEVPPSRRYFNPALKQLPTAPFPFQPEALTAPLQPFHVPYHSEVEVEGLYGVLPTGAGIENYSQHLLPFTGLQSFEPVPLASVSPAVQQFSTRPPWIPRGGTSDFKPQRLVQAGSAPANQMSASSGNRPAASANTINVADLLRQVEQLIITSNQSNNTSPANFKRKFKHPSVGK